LIVNIDGIEWKRNKWSPFAKWFLKLSEKIAVNSSHIIVADNVGIADYVESEYGIRTEVIAYGGDHALCNERENIIEDYFFTVCRIEPENNVHVILDAFSKVDKRIKIIGNWDSSEYGIELKKRFSQFENIDLLDPVYDLEVLFSYRDRCSGYIHGHSVGGTNPSLVEIMHFGKNVFAFDCVFNRYTTEENAFFFGSSDQLQQLLNTNYEIDSSYSKTLKNVANNRYTWKIVTKQYENLYWS
jgi:glycosyltransferase involved in cell wall biosynthesis